ncbi:MAG: hypothetical protein ABJH45_02940 [Paracoccaceae bacterium]
MKHLNLRASILAVTVSGIIASVGTSADAWTYERSIVEGWMAVELKSEDHDITFSCVGPIPEQGSRVQPDTFSHLKFPTLIEGIYLTLGPDALPITARAIYDVSITVAEREIPIPRMEHIERNNVYWTVLDEEVVDLILSDASSDLIVQRSRLLGFGTKIESQIPILNAAVLYDELAKDCAAILNRERL